MTINQTPMIISRPLKTAARFLVGFVAPLAAVLLPAPAAHAQRVYPTPYTFTTFAGTPYVPGGANGTGAAAQFYAPGGVATDASGNIYVADQLNNTIRKVTPAGVVTTLAGTPGVIGSNDGTGPAAQFNSPLGVAVDGSGNVFVADTSNDTIRKITPGGVVTTFAGTAGGLGNNDGTGAAAQFNNPIGVVVNGSGTLFVVDQVNHTVRQITSAGVVTTFAGTAGVPGSIDGQGIIARFRYPAAIAMDGSGNLYIGDGGNSTVRMITPSGAVTTLAGTAGKNGSTDGTGAAARFYAPQGVAVDGSGNVYVCDYDNILIRKIAPGGVVTTISGVLQTPGFVDGTGTAAEYNYPFGIGTDTSGNIYIADTGNNTIRKMAPGVVVTTLAGTPGSGYTDGTGSSARFNYPTDMALDPSGNLYVVDNTNCTIRKITPSGVVTTVAGTPGAAGTVDGTGAAAHFNYPYGIALDGSGNLYVTDQVGQAIRKIAPGGVVTTIAGTPGTAGSANGTGSAALFFYPAGIAVDGSGNVFVSEERNFDIREITPSGVVTTLAGTAGASGGTDGTGPAAKFNVPAGMTIDGSGNLYVADFGGATIRKITPAGVVTTVAGKDGNQGSADGTGAAAQFDAPSGVAVDASGNLYVADEKNDTIRMITPAGVVTTLAGKATVFGSTNGTGEAALFNQPFDVVVDGSGNLFVADANNDVIRKGSLSGAPQVLTQPSDQYSSVGGSATFSVSASGSSGLTYQWNLNGSPIAGATGSSYTISNVQASNAGSYTVTVTDSDGSTTSTAANLFVNTGSGSARLINISTRAQVGTGGNILIPGFVISGGGTESLLIRADGPALTQFGVAGALAQPILSVLNSSGTMIATNTGWGTNTNPAQIASVAAQVGAFALTSGSADCALIVNLTAGAYTVQVSGVSGSTGVALAEVYEVSSSGTRLVNISTRAQVGTGGNVLIPGFVIGGTGTEQLLVRADGPALTQFGVAGALAQPSLSVFNSVGTMIASNTGWGTNTNPTPAVIASIASSVGAFALVSGSADSADVVNLAPGAYTIQISGVNSTTGVALAEVYEVP